MRLLPPSRDKRDLASTMAGTSAANGNKCHLIVRRRIGTGK